MNTIELDHTLPSVFAGSAAPASDIWLKQVTLERGRLYLVEAASGTGKTSLCSYLIGHRHDYEGTIRFDGRDIRTFSTAEWVAARRGNVSSLFQELRLFPELTAMENVQIKNTLTHHKTLKQVSEWFEALGISDKTDVRVGQMSVGQQQRVALVRALVQPFDFIFADEPVSHLDDENGRVMGEIMLAEARAQGAAIVVTSIGKHIPLPYDTVFKL